MSTFQSKYTDEQREAVAEAVVTRGIRPARKVVELAASGDLTGEPFEITVDMVNHYARQLRRRRAGQIESDLATKPPRDAVEALRRRLVNLVDGELRALEHKQTSKNGKGSLDPERIRQIARATREIAALPGPNDPRPVKPGQRDPAQHGKNAGGPTRGGLAGKMLAELNTTPQPATDHTHPETKNEAAQTQDTESHAPRVDTHAPSQPTPQPHTQPDSWVRARVAELAGAGDS